MADFTLQELFDHVTLTASVSELQSTDQLVLAAEFMAGARQVDSSNYNIIVSRDDRRPFALSASNGAARPVDTTGRYTVPGYALSEFVVFDLEDFILQALVRERNGETVSRHELISARDIVEDEVDKLRNRRSVTRNLAIALALRGVLGVDRRTGDLTSNIGGASVQEVPSGLSDDRRLSVDAAGIWKLSLSDPDADIESYLEKMDEQQSRESKPRITDIWLHTDARRLLRANTKFAQEFADVDQSAARALRGDVIEAYGKNWHFTNVEYEDPATGTMVPYIPPGDVIFTPPASDRSWHTPAELSRLVPNRIGVFQSLDDMAGSLDVAYGPHGFMAIQPVPAKGQLYLGDSFGWTDMRDAHWVLNDSWS